MYNHETSTDLYPNRPLRAIRPFNDGQTPTAMTSDRSAGGQHLESPDVHDRESTRFAFLASNLCGVGKLVGKKGEAGDCHLPSRTSGLAKSLRAQAKALQHPFLVHRLLIVTREKARF
ncbi:hypothetical protein BJF93_09145 [Xaviernesmea oryzae]|uniref:Uncharacterized protein n=1 Tax=Xaviernesmea oryzae TaxID=464029 RepID=A0A1Q9ATU1_9HYPH|nr:hypothetical protein [Xaviernesmea oryzae]OLP58844.1 hypothetical protein BJF93_09145 [Xaviernesmea oryzae]SEM11298.1 hypothetical protein SAMN04487976_11992 [Xaviernesmea oryzae]